MRQYDIRIQHSDTGYLASEMTERGDTAHDAFERAMETGSSNCMAGGETYDVFVRSATTGVAIRFEAMRAI